MPGPIEVLMSEDVYVQAGFATDSLPALEVEARGREGVVKVRSAVSAADLAALAAAPAEAAP